jgi:hypothetical protein
MPKPTTVNCEVVLNLTVTVVEGEASTIAEELDKLHVAATAPPKLQLTLSGNANPAIGAIDAVVETASPAMTLPEVGFSTIVKSTAFPIIVAVRPLYRRLLEFTVKDPGWDPVVFGWNVIFTAQDAPAATLDPQADVSTL